TRTDVSLQGAGALTASLLKRGGATLGLIDQPRCGRAPPRLHPGIGPKSAGSAGSSSGAQFHDRHIPSVYIPAKSYSANQVSPRLQGCQSQANESSGPSKVAPRNLAMPFAVRA